ncbi:MAG: hypothetical protein IKG77_01955, partial [Prevotella sp.]|nr:hypothetical protein [Prevotella sp.]
MENKRPAHCTLRPMALLFILLLNVLTANAQRQTLSGRVVDNDSREALPRTTLQLYRISRKDTTFVEGTFSDERGAFLFSGVGQG